MYIYTFNNLALLSSLSHVLPSLPVCTCKIDLLVPISSVLKCSVRESRV